MAAKDTASIVEEMLHDFSPFSLALGGLEFYGTTIEFRDLLDLCRDFASVSGGKEASLNKAYLFAERYHGKSAIARATELEAKANGLSVFSFDGTAGATQKALLDLQPRTYALTIIDGLPEPAASRRTLLDRFNSLRGRGLLFATPEYSADANLDQDIPDLRLSHIDQRPLDKLALLIGIVREHLRDVGLSREQVRDAVSQLPVRALIMLSSIIRGPNVGKMADLGSRVGEVLRVKIEFEPGRPFPEDELALVFLEFFSPSTRQSPRTFRLWVEGDSDCRILRLTSRLAKQARNIDPEDGLSILPVGEGRGGGTSKVQDVVVSHQIRRNLDIFLLDFDEPGRHAKEELQILGQDVLLLDPKVSCSRSDSDVEIEDFINVSCLDRFYEAHPDLRPEKEVIRYKLPKARRLVVDGVDKDALVEWLESNASLNDLENLFFVLCDIRGRFSLKNELSGKEVLAWKRRLEEESNQDKLIGNRPHHWS
jgi:hypothetical protein